MCSKSINRPLDFYFEIKMLVDRKHLQFKHPFTCMVAGPTSSGKTTLVRRILQNHDLLFYNIDGDILRIMWAYGQWQSLYTKDIGQNVECLYVSGLPSEDDIKEANPHLIVIDDLMAELGNNKKLSNLFTKGSHHNNISIIFIAQNIFHQGSQMRTVSLNCHYTIIMKNPRDKSQLNVLGRQMFPNNTKFFLEAYQDATGDNDSEDRKVEFGYLLIDLKQDTPNKLRLRTRITPEEHEKIYKRDLISVIYIPK